MTTNFKNKTLLITGGTGTFGRAVLDRLIDTDIKEIRIFSRDEQKQDDMKRQYKSSKVKFYIGDVRDIDSVKSAMWGVDYVFHAAALKIISACEDCPIQAVKTNVIGTDNVLNAAVESGVKKIIVLSTDKACYPISSMGTSKAIMEKVALAKSRTTDPKSTTICITRYGNIICSRGSVVPLFVDQIKSGNPLTISNPDMTRFLMSIDQAVDLVMFAFENAQSGDIFVQKSLTATIGELGTAVKQIFKSNAEIKITGQTCGEKNHETLLTREECQVAIDMGGFYRVPIKPTNAKSKLPFDEYNSFTAQRFTEKQLKEILVKSGVK